MSYDAQANLFTMHAKVPEKPKYIWRATPHVAYQQESHFHFVPFPASVSSQSDQMTKLSHAQVHEWHLTMGFIFASIAAIGAANASAFSSTTSVASIIIAITAAITAATSHLWPC